MWRRSRSWTRRRPRSPAARDGRPARARPPPRAWLSRRRAGCPSRSVSSQCSSSPATGSMAAASPRWRLSWSGLPGAPAPPRRSTKRRACAWAISSLTEPSKRSRPARSSVTRSAKPRISSRRWVVQSTAAPSRASSSTSPRMPAAASGSRSCVASSTRITDGLVSRARATERRFCMPCENVATGPRARSARPTCSSTASARRRASRLRSPCRRAKNMRFSSADSRR